MRQKPLDSTGLFPFCWPHQHSFRRATRCIKPSLCCSLTHSSSGAAPRHTPLCPHSMHSSRDRRSQARGSYPDAASASSSSVLPPLFAAKPAQHSSSARVGQFTPRMPSSARKAALPHLQQQQQLLRDSSFAKSARGANNHSRGGGARMIASGGALSQHSSGRKIASGSAAGSASGAANKNATRITAAVSDEATVRTPRRAMQDLKCAGHVPSI